jgi:glycosyltransferase involved in cell wall biosynthesis
MPTVLYYGSSTQVHSGAAQWMYRLADGMRSRGFRTLAVLDENDGIASQYLDAGIDTRFLYSKPIRLRRSVLGQVAFLFGSILAVLRLTLLIRREDVDIVHVNEVTYPQGLVAGRLGRAKVVCHVRASYESRTVRKLFAYFSTIFAHEIVCVSERTKELMFADTGVGTETVRVSYDGLPSPERFEPLPDGSQFRREIGVTEDDFLVVQVSKLVSIKGQDTLVSAAEQLVSQHSDIHVALVGGDVDGHESYANQLRSQVETMDAVTLVGFYPDITEPLAAADVVVHVPEYEDPFPGVVLEAMLAGRPVVASQTGGIPEQVEHGETGLLVSATNDPSDIASAILELYQDKPYREALGKQASEQVRNNYSTAGHFSDIDDVYRRLLN